MYSLLVVVVMCGTTNRGVSWDLAIQAGRARAAEADAVSAVTQPAIVSLKDLVGVAPMESEAETLLLHAIEENAAAVQDPGTATHALNNLTPQEESLFTGTAAADDPSTASSSRVLPASSKKSLFSKSATQDTTKHLWDLARHMKQHNQRSSRTDSLHSDDDQVPAAAGHSDLLAVHAAKLLSQRKQKQKAEQEEEEAAAAAAPKNKWSTLRAAVQMNVAVAAAAADKKKDDHAAVQEEQANGDVEQGSTDSNSGNVAAMAASSTGGMKAKKEINKEKGIQAEFHAFR